MNEDNTAVILKLSADYYAHHAGAPMPRPVREMLQGAVKNGIIWTQIMDAIDTAVAAYGMCANGRDMLVTMRDELRRAWRKQQADDKAAP